MVNFTIWEEFQQQVESMTESDLFKTRYVTRYNHESGELILKVTNGPKTYKYKTTRLSDLSKFHRLNKSLSHIMSSKSRQTIA